jgi:FtsZ-interacting cell division protein ZipA
LLIRITWALVLAGLGLVIGGFLTTDSNVLLILAIAVEIAAIILVLASWARRAREATAGGFDEELTFAGDDTSETQEEELYAALESDDEFAVGGARRTSRSTSRPARKPAGSSPARKSAAKAKPAAAARKSAAKSTAKTPAKSAAKKPAKAKAPVKAKAKPKAPAKATRPKAGQPRRRPPSASP